MAYLLMFSIINDYTVTQFLISHRDCEFQRRTNRNKAADTTDRQGGLPHQELPTRERCSAVFDHTPQ